MQAWGEATGAAAGGITMLADATGAFTKAIGMDFDAPPVGFSGRSKRYAMLVDDGVVKVLNIEEAPGRCEISGGEARRASLARTLAPRPKYLLMDEPLTNVDVDLKIKLMHCIQKALVQTNASLIYVTHDASEAENVSDRIFLLKDGCLMGE